MDEENVTTGGACRSGWRCTTAARIDVVALKKAAENGDDHAQTLLGALLATGDGVKKDEKAAIGWFEKAADSGNTQAQAVLGELYGLGWGGLKKDEAKAAKWMEKAGAGRSGCCKGGVGLDALAR